MTRDRPRKDRTGKVEGNERLTTMTGALLLVLFIVECVTIVAMRQLFTLHFFLGVALIGPVLLKTGSTLYRFARYYTGSPAYRRKGPPALMMRVLGPLVILTSFSVIGTGIMLGFAKSDFSLWLMLHRTTFALWFVVILIHVHFYIGRLSRAVSSGLLGRVRDQGRQALGGRAARWLLLTASVIAGVILAMLTYHQAGVWLSTHRLPSG